MPRLALARVLWLTLAPSPLAHTRPSLPSSFRPCIDLAGDAQVYDESGSGYISRLELANVLRAMVAHHHGEREMAEDEFLRLLNLVFESMDVVGDNRISFDGGCPALSRGLA